MCRTAAGVVLEDALRIPAGVIAVTGVTAWVFGVRVAAGGIGLGVAAGGIGLGVAAGGIGLGAIGAGIGGRVVRAVVPQRGIDVAFRFARRAVEIVLARVGHHPDGLQEEEHAHQPEHHQVRQVPPLIEKLTEGPGADPPAAKQ